MSLLTRPLLLALGAGALAGARSLTPPAQIARHFQEHPSAALEESPLGWIAAPGAAAAAEALAAAEMLADKTPWIPDRTSPPGLLGRITSGALAGGAILAAAGGCWKSGAAAGAAAAALSTFALYTLRKSLHEELHVPDPVLGTLEDMAVIAMGKSLLRSLDG